MCRLLGTVSRTPVTLDEVLGERRADFLALAHQHGDGWGHAWAGRDGLDVRKGPDSALVSAELAALAAGQASEAALTHLRWATLGLPVRPANSHPFSADGLAFAHNGSISPPEALDTLVDPELVALRRGDTDSERYFLAVLSRVRRGATPAEALVATVCDVLVSGARVHSLNCLLLTPDALLAVCCYDAAGDEDPDYYPLLYRGDGGTVVVSSTGWTDNAGWSVLGNGQMLVVERGSLHTSVLPVGRPGPGGRSV